MPLVILKKTPKEDSMDEIICIRVTIEEYNGVKLIIGYEMYEKLTGELRATGTSTPCFSDKNGKLLNLKKSYTELHEILTEGRKNPAAE